MKRYSRSACVELYEFHGPSSECLECTLWCCRICGVLPLLECIWPSLLQLHCLSGCSCKGRSLRQNGTAVLQGYSFHRASLRDGKRKGGGQFPGVFELHKGKCEASLRSACLTPESAFKVCGMYVDILQAWPSLVRLLE